MSEQDYNQKRKIIELQGQVNRLCILVNYINTLLTPENKQKSFEMLDSCYLTEETKQQLYDSRFTKNRKDKARTNAETTC